jgi:diguanylate cyclase (GGDEF)-like protein
MYQSELTHPADIENEKIRLYELILGQTTTVQFEKRYRSQLGNDIWTLVNVSLLMQQDEPLCYLYQIHDLTERKETEYRLSLLAHYDPLTGLANRLRLWEEADSQILVAKRQREGLAVLFIDLDNFKQINDSMGHEAGDLLLQEVALRLRAAVRESDCVARLGGDEFVLLLPNVQSAEDVSAITNKIWAGFAKPVMIENHAIMVGLSMGVSLYPDDGQDAKTLLRCADSALYHAKSEGRNNMQFYRLELTARLGHKLKMERGLRIAIEQQQFEIYYQPIITMSGGGIHSAEALIRWHHPDLGLVMPDTFIQLTEETGLISPIGEWVMREACRQAVTWQRDGHEGIGISVNVSARQFKSNEIMQHVEGALADSGLSPALLTLEVTEQLMLQNTEQNLALIADLKNLGVRLAIDDFGVGYSSLNYIKRFNPHKLKIDRSFVHDLVGNPEDEAIVRAIVAMAHSLKMLVVAEGIETEVQRNFLQQEGCDLAQGFFYAKPCSAEDFCAWIAGHPDSPGYYPGN